MESTDLKIAAGSIITESKMSKATKLQLLNFVQNEATDHQIMALMLDGKVVKLDEQAEQVVEDRFKVSKLNELAFIVLAGLWATAIAGAIRVYNRFLSQAARACLKVPDKDVCMSKFKVKALVAKRNYLKGQVSKCKQTKDPEECQRRFAAGVSKIEKQIMKAQTKV